MMTENEFVHCTLYTATHLPDPSMNNVVNVDTHFHLLVWAMVSVIGPMHEVRQLRPARSGHHFRIGCIRSHEDHGDQERGLRFQIGHDNNIGLE
jgi:hypothetical protein